MAQFRLGPQGRIVIPAALRRRLRLATGDELVAWVEGERLVLERRDAALAELKGIFASSDGRGVERLIAERRAEAAREEAELTGDAGLG